MRGLHLVSELAAGLAVMLFVPVAVLLIGTPIVLLARLVIGLIERF